jgi:hemolysin III
MTWVERWNATTHGVGAVAATAGAIALVVLAATVGDPWKVASMAVYGATLIALYVSSTLYHGSRGGLKPTFRKMDHVAIYLLIAGTYTPFLLGPLRGPWGWALFGVVWTLALVGIVQDLCRVDPRRILSVVIYVGMGWLAVVALGPLMRALPVTALLWVLAGGLAYTVGIVFYAVDHRWPSAHVVWHGFVLAGSACHFFAIARYLT